MRQYKLLYERKTNMPAMSIEKETAGVSLVSAARQRLFLASIWQDQRASSFRYESRPMSATAQQDSSCQVGLFPPSRFAVRPSLACACEKGHRGPPNVGAAVAPPTDKYHYVLKLYESPQE